MSVMLMMMLTIIIINICLIIPINQYKLKQPILRVENRNKKERNQSSDQKKFDVLMEKSAWYIYD